MQPDTESRSQEEAACVRATSLGERTEDLESLDAEANAAITRRSIPRAIFIGVRASETGRDKRASASRKSDMKRSMFRQMVDSLLGLTVHC